jgi:hypothetical protein
VKTAAVESAVAVESSAVVESPAAVEPATAMRSATAAVHLRVGGSYTAENRECRDTCDYKLLHPRLSHSRTSFIRTSSAP